MSGVVKVEWKTADDPRWLAWLLLSTAVSGALLVLDVTVRHGVWWTCLAWPVTATSNAVATSRSRLRLIDEGIEVRKLRTRLYRWSDIASIERAPEWESTALIWLRLRGSVSTSDPEVLGAPGTRGQAARDRALDDIVAFVRRRVASESSA